MKFGGTSVADAERITRAAQRIVERAREGNHVVAVLSARGKHTDELVALAQTVVMKFGGTSVADPDRIKRAAGRIAA
ncbi:MAG: aspartate kinase, partial [Thermoleophilaceae bacterium]|nr:aspartate kinase [Thermoleophilaceae bacterium]